VSGAALHLSGVVVEAAGRRILGPVDLDVRSGEHVLLVGPSGCGKSTLLRAIAGLETLAAGRLEIDGRLANEGARTHLAPAERGVGFLFQGGALWPHMSARRTLEFVLKRCGVPRRERAARATELLEQVELRGFERRLPGTLSGGEAQRLALARALAGEPRILLLDEPLGPLDAELRGALLARLAEVHAELGLTILHVTHDPQEARGLATRTLRLRDGQVEASLADDPLADAPTADDPSSTPDGAPS